MEDQSQNLPVPSPAPSPEVEQLTLEQIHNLRGVMQAPTILPPPAPPVSVPYIFSDE